MRHFLVALTTVLLARFCVAAATSQPAAAAPTMGEIRDRFDSADYQGVLREIARALSLGGKAAEEYKKYDLLILRGEAELRLKQPEPAAVAFHQAGKETQDDQNAATALATELLIRHSRQLQYVPKIVEKGVKAQPLDIVEAESRKNALQAMYADELAAVAPKVKAGQAATGLPAIVQAVKAVDEHHLFVLDQASNGNVDHTHKAVAALKDHAIKLISQTIKAYSKRVSDISLSANKRSLTKVTASNSSSGGSSSSYQHAARGLQGTEGMELNSIARNAADITRAIQDLIVPIADKGEADDLLRDADLVRKDAIRTAQADYTH